VKPRRWLHKGTEGIAAGVHVLLLKQTRCGKKAKTAMG
jgi:hypothetical protein